MRPSADERDIATRLLDWSDGPDTHILTDEAAARITELRARLAEAERLLALRLPAGVVVNRVHIGKGCNLRTLASAIEGPRPADSASVCADCGEPMDVTDDDIRLCWKCQA